MHEATERPRHIAERRDRRSGHGVLTAGLVTSALVHAALFFLFSFSIPLEPRVSYAPPSRIVHVAPAMQAYDIVEVQGDVAPLEVQIREREALRPLPARVAPPGAPAVDAPGEPAVAESDDPMSVRDRLRYRLTTPQVWRPPTEEVAVEPTPQELLHQRIAAQLGAFNDSVAAEADAAARARDWTVKDGNGGRWGVTPTGIHLGSVTIPIPFDVQMQPADGRREEFAGRVRTWTEIQGQALRAEARESIKDRVKAIEERMDRERAARTAATAPDTAKR